MSFASKFLRRLFGRILAMPEEQPAIPKRGYVHLLLSGGRGRGGFFLGDDFLAFEISDAALALFAFIVLFAHKFFTLLQ
jgi:hypothetical protein